MAQITTDNAINAIVKMVAMDALTLLSGTLVMGSLVNRSFEAVIQTQGDTINVPIPPTMKANNIAEGGTLNNQSPSLGNAQIVLNTHAEASFQLGDIAKILVQPDLLSILLGSATQAIAERIETDLMKCYPLLTDNTDVGGNAAIDEGKLDDAETALFNARVPILEPKYAVVNAGTYSDIRMLPRFSENQTIGNPMAAQAIMQGSVGMIKNLNVIRSHFVQQTAGPLTHNIVFARDAIALVTRRLPPVPPGMGAIVEYAEMGGFGMRVIMSYVHGVLGTQCSMDCLYGCGALRPSFGVNLTTNT
jgi:hypothetical protein